MKLSLVTTLITFAQISGATSEHTHILHDASVFESVGEIEESNHSTERRLDRDLQIINTVASSSQPSYNAAFATDNDLFTRWESNESDNEWIYVEFSTVHSLDTVSILWETAHAKHYNLETSNDAVSWTTVAQVRNSAGGQERTDFQDSVSARYLRMKGIDRATTHGYSILEITVSRYESAYVPIVGASASSELNGNLAEYAIDSDFDTRWSSSRGRNHWLSVEFDQSYPLSLAVFSWAYAYGEDYDVQTSQDGVSWTTAVEVRDRTGGIDIVNFPLGTVAAHVRMQGIKAGRSTGYSLYDVSFLEGTALPDLPPAITTASSFENDKNEDHFPPFATDNDLDTRWASIRGLDNQWLAIDYGFPQVFSRVELYWEDAYGVDYDIEVSDDGSTWTTALEVRNGNGGVDTLDLPSGISGRAIRMFGIKRATKYGFSLFEMYVNHSQDVFPPDESEDIGIVGATASSQLSTSYRPSRAIDGIVKTSWASSNPPNRVDGEILVLELDQTYTVTLVVVVWEASAHAEEYEIQLSNNGQIWRSVASVTREGSNVDTIDVLSDYEAKYIGIKCNVPGINGAYSIQEVTAKGYSV